MKKFLFTATLLISSTFIFAQAKFGVKAGVNFANMTIKANGSDIGISPASLTSFHIGGFGEFPLSSTIYLQPGLSLSGKGFKIDESESEPGFSYSQKSTLKLLYLEIPLNFLAKFPAGSGKFFIGGGPYLALGISGNAKNDEKLDAPGTVDDYAESSDEDVKFGSKDEEVKPLDFGLNILTGYELANGLFINANYGLGLSTTNNEQNINIKNKVVSLSIGFKF
ncbi:MAG: PorT family protein [Pyrinomonadaceae bacterium]|nr:PorT family protein [Sphingobacteriaceae bacterium]